MTDDNQAEQTRDRRGERRRTPDPQPEPQGAHPSTTATTPPSLLYLDPDWIAANMRALIRQTSEALVRSGSRPDDAMEAVFEAIAALYERPRPELDSRRNVSRFLRLVAARVERRRRQRRTLIRIDLHAAPLDAVMDDEAQVLVEDQLRYDAIRAVLATMGPGQGAPLLEILRRELAAMLEADDHEGQPLNDAERMRLSRARERLRRRTQDWLVGIPVVRTLWHRHIEPGAVQVAVGAAYMVSVVALSFPLVSDGATNVRTVAESTLSTRRQSSAGAVGSLPHRSSPPPQPVRSVAEKPPVAGPQAQEGPTADSATPLVEGSRHGILNHDRPPGDTSLACVRRLRGLDDRCVPHPLMTSPTDQFREPPMDLLD